MQSTRVTGVAGIGFLAGWARVCLLALCLLEILWAPVSSRNGDVVEWTLSGMAWEGGVFNDLIYAGAQGGITLPRPGLSPIWMLELPDTLVTDLLLDENGAVFVTGTKKLEGSWRPWFAVIDAGGRLVWERTEEERTSQAVAIAWMTEGRVVATGWSSEALLLACFSADGIRLWRREIADAGRLLGKDIAATAGRIYVGGINVKQEVKRGFILGCDRDGNTLWQHVFGDETEVLAVTAFPTGEAAVLWKSRTGMSLSVFDGDGTHLWTVAFPAAMRSVQFLEGQGGSRFVLGEYLDEDDGVGRLEVYRFTPRRFPKKELESPAHGFRVAAAAMGRYGKILVGGQRSRRSWLVLLGSEGKELWTEELGSASESDIRAIVHRNGRWAIATSQSQGGVRTYLALWRTKLDPPEGEYIGPIKDWGYPVVLRILEVRGEKIGEGNAKIIVEFSEDGFDTIVERREWIPSGDEQMLVLDNAPPARYVRIRVYLKNGVHKPVVKEIQVTGERWKGFSSPSMIPPPVSRAIAPRIRVEPGVGLAGQTAFRFHVEGVECRDCVWQFGDGEATMGNQVTHVYGAPGIYIATLTDAGKVLGQQTITVYAVEWESLFLPFQARWFAAAGDFDGDGRADLVTWTQGKRTIFLFHGNGDGQFLLQSNRQFIKPIQAVEVLDLDKDGKDDLIVVETDLQEGLWYLKGSEEMLLQEAIWLSVPIRIFYPVESEAKLLLYGMDWEEEYVVCWVQWEGGRPQIRIVPAPGAVPSFVTLEAGSAGMRMYCLLFEHRGWAFWGGSGEPTSSVFADVLAVGDCDGKGITDVVGVSREGVLLWLREEGTTINLSPFREDDRWITVDLNGDGADEVVRLGPLGTITVHFLLPARSAIAVSLPTDTGTCEPLALDIEGDGREEILFLSHINPSFLLRLSGP